ncbi:MAG: sulfotransferase family 2 domain-containing protein [bacterium]|nr:sulfotransferase family 2 domain-containing protein [bacterium]
MSLISHLATVAKPSNVLESIKSIKLSSQYSIKGDYKRIYLYHIRKTGGTSLNHMFLSLGGRDGRDVYREMMQKPNHRIISSNKVFAGFNHSIIKRGNYYYAFSHEPMHEVVIPDKTFTVTCVRDPLERVVSHYKMLIEMKQDNAKHPGMQKQSKWLGNSFEDFLKNIPKKFLLNQLYMFSKEYSIDEATTNIVSCSHFFFTENFSQGVAGLSDKLGIQLQALHTRKTPSSIMVTEKEQDQLREMLEPEYILYKKLSQIKESA